MLSNILFGISWRGKLPAHDFTGIIIIMDHCIVSDVIIMYMELLQGHSFSGHAPLHCNPCNSVGQCYILNSIIFTYCYVYRNPESFKWKLNVDDMHLIPDHTMHVEVKHLVILHMTIISHHSDDCDTIIAVLACMMLLVWYFCISNSVEEYLRCVNHLVSFPTALTLVVFAHNNYTIV